MKSQSYGATPRWIVLFAICAGASWLINAGVRHELAHHFESSANPNDWVRATAVEPANAEIWYQLGRYRQLDFEHVDLPAAISYYRHAVQADPQSAFYKLDLASSLELTGNTTEAEKYYRAAQENFPISAEVAWRYGNFLLRQERLPEAYDQIHRAVLVNPKLLPLAVSRCWRSNPDAHILITQVLPGTPEGDWEALTFLVQSNEAEGALAVWRHLIALKPAIDTSKVYPFIDLLTSQGRFDDAGAVWNQIADTDHSGATQAGLASLVFNGGFEKDLSGGGFGWRYRDIADAEFEFDTDNKHSGERSAHIQFDGKQNLDYTGLNQFVLVHPNTRYRFQGFLRTEGITTDSGMRFEIRDPLRTPVLDMITTNEIGDQPWTLEELEFETGAQTQEIEIVVRRLPSQRFDNALGGNVWIDDVSLVALGSQE